MGVGVCYLSSKIPRERGMGKGRPFESPHNAGGRGGGGQKWGSKKSRLVDWCRMQKANLMVLEDPDQIQEFCASLQNTFVQMESNLEVRPPPPLGRRKWYSGRAGGRGGGGGVVTPENLGGIGKRDSKGHTLISLIRVQRKGGSCPDGAVISSPLVIPRGPSGACGGEQFWNTESPHVSAGCSSGTAGTQGAARSMSHMPLDNTTRLPTQLHRQQAVAASA